VKNFTCGNLAIIHFLHKHIAAKYKYQTKYRFERLCINNFFNRKKDIELIALADAEKEELRAGFKINQDFSFLRM
jgi:hypothetical protein